MNIDEKPRKSGCYSGGSLRLEARLLHHLLALFPQVLTPAFGDLPALPMKSVFPPVFHTPLSYPV